MMSPMRALLCLLFVAAAGPAMAAGGADAFERDCASCHPIDGPSSANGPSLKGVIWRRIASLPDFTYSAALKGVGGTWTPQRLDAFLRDTQGFARGTDMFFDIRDAATRRAIVDYLKTVK